MCAKPSFVPFVSAPVDFPIRQVCQAQEARENTHPRTRLRYIPPGFNVAAHEPYYAQAAARAGASVTPMGDVMKVQQPPSDQATLIFFGSLDRWSHRSVSKSQL